MGAITEARLEIALIMQRVSQHTWQLQYHWLENNASRLQMWPKDLYRTLFVSKVAQYTKDWNGQTIITILSVGKNLVLPHFLLRRLLWNILGYTSTFQFRVKRPSTWVGEGLLILLKTPILPTEGQGGPERWVSQWDVLRRPTFSFIFQSGWLKTSSLWARRNDIAVAFNSTALCKSERTRMSTTYTKETHLTLTKSQIMKLKKMTWSTARLVDNDWQHSSFKSLIGKHSQVIQKEQNNLHGCSSKAWRSHLMSYLSAALRSKSDLSGRSLTLQTKENCPKKEGPLRIFHLPL